MYKAETTDNIRSRSVVILCRYQGDWSYTTIVWQFLWNCDTVCHELSLKQTTHWSLVHTEVVWEKSYLSASRNTWSNRFSVSIFIKLCQMWLDETVCTRNHSKDGITWNTDTFLRFPLQIKADSFTQRNSTRKISLQWICHEFSIKSVVSICMR